MINDNANLGAPSALTPETRAARALHGRSQPWLCLSPLPSGPCISCCEVADEIEAAVLDARAEERKSALAAVQHARDHYAEDIFDPAGTSPECRSAKWARGLLDGIMEDIRTAYAEGTAARSAAPKGLLEEGEGKNE